jgi:hypothetical protein
MFFWKLSNDNVLSMILDSFLQGITIVMNLDSSILINIKSKWLIRLPNC